METVQLSKWQRIQYQVNLPLGADRQFVTACREHIDISRQAAAEGMVLLKNEEETLPLERGQKIAIFGKAQADYVKGGGGSGDVRPPYEVNLLEGLQGKSVSVYAPVSAYYAEYVRQQRSQGKQPGWIPEPELAQELLDGARAFTDTAIVVLCRYSKESVDRTGAPQDGDFYLSEAEETMVSQVLAAFPRTVLVLNTGGMMDTCWFKDDPRVGAALLAWQGGMEGGRAMADILCGDVNPSGHLTDTFAVDFDAYPSSKGFNESDLYVEYQEDIFVGYRYFETLPGAAEKVCYPFGWGLSYTDFALTQASLERGKMGMTLKATVLNTGKRSGKQVLQLYCQPPQGKLGKASRVLVGFEKTRLLAPGESQELTVFAEFDKLASFDDRGAVCANAWILEKGQYCFYLGENVRDAELLGDTLDLDKDMIWQRLSEKCAPQNLTRRLQADGSWVDTLQPKAQREPFTYTDDPELPTNARETPPPEAFWEVEQTNGRIPLRKQLRDVHQGKITLDQLLDDMSDAEQVHLLCGQPNRGPANTFGWGNLPNFGVPNAMTADGPAGLRFLKLIDVKTTAFPCATLLACTWNRELVEEVGRCGAREVKEQGMAIWLTPAANIHRSPLCGRNFEYYSEDPLVSGEMAAAMVRGIQSQGVAASLKHFACNNKEVNRKNSDSILSCRALREIYLKGFEICVKTADPWSIMSSYNLINGVNASENKELLTDILRGEWGYEGLVMTDWWGHSDHHLEVLAGNDVKMPGGFPARLQEALDQGLITRDDLLKCVRRLMAYICKLD